MECFYQDEMTQIWCGDCADFDLTPARFDLVLTDPPYGIGEAAEKNKSRGGPFGGKKNRSRGRRIEPKDYGNKDWDNKPIDAALMGRIIKAGQYACVFGGNFYDLPPTPSWLIWDKVNGQLDFADVEMAWTNYGTAARLFRHMWNGMLRKNREARFHPTQKPVDLMKWCIKKSPGWPDRRQRSGS